MTTAYPLAWPAGWPRTPAGRRTSSRFEPAGLAAEAAKAIDEIRLLGGRLPVVSTNIELRRDGLPYSGQRPPDDPGVAVYFMLDDRQQCIPCDRWSTVEENLRAIWKSIEALRGLDRWGAKSFVDAAFAGFTALPAPPAARPWHVVLGVNASATAAEIEAAYRALIRKHHPDAGGTAEQASEINAARDAGLKEQPIP